MAYSYVVYTGNGSTTQFAITFPYIRKEHVKVYVNYVDTAYTYVNDTTVQLATAPASPLRVEVRRVTPLANVLVDYTDGSTLVAADLDTSNLQSLYNEQELDDNQKRGIFVDDATGLITAGGQRITNVANPVNAQDAATKTYVDTADALKVNKAGDTMSGALAMGTNKITGLGTPTANADAATKLYVDTVTLAGNVPDGDRGDITVSGVGTSWTIDAGLPASRSSFTQTGTGAVARTVDSKLKDIVSITDFGAVGDGVTNDRAAIQAALNTGKNVFVPNGTFLYNSNISFTASGQTFYGSGNKSILKAGSGGVYIQSNSCNNISLNDLRIECGATNGGFLINGSQNVTVSRIYWYEGLQVVWLFTCNTIKVVDCTFEGITYGIIQQAGHASSFVLIDSNIALDMTGDFVEANCESGTPSSSWTITSNVFKGSRDWPTTGTEKRFVGITSVNGVVIDGNVVEKVAGDAAIHLENTLGETVISNNVFDNCMGSGGNSGYIYFLNTAENTIVTGNIFLRTDTTIAAATAIQSANNYSHSLQFVGNRVVAPAGSTNFSGLFTSFYYGPAVIADNIFENLQYAITTTTVTNFQITGNTFDACVVGITRGNMSGGGGGTDFLVADNVFYGTTGTYDIFTSQNSSGTQAGKRWLIQSNKFVKQLYIGAQIGAAPGDSGDAEDFQVLNNVFSSTASLITSGTLSRFKNSGNVFQGTGVQDLTGTTVNATTLNATNLGNFEGLINYRPLKNRTTFSDYQNGVHLTGISSDYSISDNSVNMPYYLGGKFLNIGSGFILPKNYSGTVTFNSSCQVGAFDLIFQSSADGTTWTTLASYGSGVNGAQSYAFSSLATALALRFAFSNGNGTNGNIIVNTLVIPNLNAAQIAQATGAGKVILHTPYFPNVTTTAAGANAVLDNTSTPANQLLRSTSSIRYKTEIENLEPLKADAILNLRPIWYRSLADADPKEWSYYGLLAEEVAEIEPRLVSWTYPEDAFETIEEIVEIDEEEIVKQVVKLKEGFSKMPDGVQYDRLTVLLLDIVKRQQQAIKTLETKVASLENT